MWIQLQDINRDENGIEEKDVTIPNGEENANEAGEKAGKEADSKKNNGELIVDKNTQKILKSLSNGNGNKKPKKQNNFEIQYS